MLHRIKNKIEYLNKLYNIHQDCDRFCKGHSVKLYNWSRPFLQDMWLIDFIEKRGLLADKKKKRICLHSVFGPVWMTRFDNADGRIFVERENLHKPQFKDWLHRYLDDDRFGLSLGFDYISHPKYMRFPFWIMWNVFSPTADYDEIKQRIDQMDSVDNHSYDDRKFCAYLCSHDDIGRRELFNQFSGIGHVDCDGKLFHNNDELKEIYNDDKLAYLRNYRFNLTPENNNQKDYVTEKLFEAISSGCIPIYHGSDNLPEPEILNHDAIIFIEVGGKNDAALSMVKELDADRDKYLEFANQKRFQAGAADIIWEYYMQLENRIKEIVANI